MTQLTQADLANMSAAEIVAAKRAGKLNSLLGIPLTLNQTLDAAERTKDSAPVTEGQLTLADLDNMSPAEIVSAKRAGRLDVLLGHPTD
ncbi:hypothetical protein ABZV67_10670 [Streptomyces sp. NPDC005065]|uniref:hypothetical protein n=1 Tax=Streptomyces sp. NPDC005065 TaxID=3154461 RepID=UPI0033A72F77